MKALLLRGPGYVIHGVQFPVEVEIYGEPDKYGGVEVLGREILKLPGYLMSEQDIIDPWDPDFPYYFSHQNVKVLHEP